MLFRSDAIPIETIVGEMGEVVIRGQIMTLDTREIRGEKTIIIMSVTDFTDEVGQGESTFTFWLIRGGLIGLLLVIMCFGFLKVRKIKKTVSG